MPRIRLVFDRVLHHIDARQSCLVERGGIRAAALPAASGCGAQYAQIAQRRERLAENDGALLVGVARREGATYRVRPNPPGDTVLSADDQLIVLASEAQTAALRALLDASQGRGG